MLEQGDKSELVSQKLNTEGGPGRERKMTEKGLDWHLQNIKGKLRNSISYWKKEATECSKLLSDTDDSSKIRECRTNLEGCFKAISTIADEFHKFEDHDISDLTEKFEKIEGEHLKLMSQISDTLRSLQSEKASSHHSKQTRSSRVSHQLSDMTKMDYLAESVRLKTQLKFHDAETKMKADLEKLKTLKELEVVNAKTEILNSTEPFSLLTKEEVEKLPVGDTNMYTQDFILNQSFIHADIKPVVQPPVNTNTSTKHLDPSVPPFVPPVGNVAPPTTSVPPFVPPVSNVAPPTTSVPVENINPNPNMPQPVNQSLVDLAKSLADQVALNRLPSPEPNIFYGDPIQYPSWKASFKTLIDSRNIPPHERLHYLKRYIGSPVKQVIENYFLCITDNSYEEAKKLLDERYGDPFVIASAFRDKLDSWPKIQSRDSASLLKLSDFLRQCLTGMSDISHLDVLNDCRENRKILTKLPEWLVTRWNRIVASHKEETKTFPSFKRFVDFVCKEAKIASDPVTSLQSLKGFHEPDGRIQAKGKGWQRGFPNEKGPVGSRSFVSSTNNSGRNSDNKFNSSSKFRVKSCVLCKKAHDLDTCRSFLEKPLSDRKTFARENNLCFGCLCSGHISRACIRRKTCSVCSRLHPTSFHGDTGKRPVATSGNENPEVKDPPVTNSSAIPFAPSNVKSGAAFLSLSGAESKCSAIVPVYLSHSSDPDNERLIYALLDSQSDTTFVLRDTCTALGISGTPVNLSLSTMYAVDKLVRSEKIKGLLVRGFDSCNRIPLPDSYTRDIMPANRSHIPTSDVAREWPHLENISTQFMALNSCEIGLLIGYNCPKALMPKEVIPPDGDGPFAQRTDLGWSIVGIVSQSPDENDTVGLSHRILAHEVSPKLALRNNEGTKSVLFSVRTSVKEEFVSKDILRVLERDFYSSAEVSSSLSQEDLQFLSVLEKGISFTNGHYQMPLPFKSPSPVLPNNRASALSRVRSLQRRLLADEKLRQHYTKFMSDLFHKGHAEPVIETSSKSGSVWYIPHHGVYHPHKPDKIRVVFDCSSVYQGHSLNQHLLQGPDLTNKLFGVLCRFRKEPVAVMCDIEQMFHQFKVAPECRDYLRFLWWRSEDYSEEPVDYRMTVHLFGATSSPGCANFGLKKIAQDNRHLFGDAAANFIYHDFYVDDGVKSLATISEAIDLVDKTKAMCSKGGLRLHKFVSNKKEVLHSLQPEDRANDLANIDLVRDKLPIERALGLLWCIESDTFQFRIVLKDRPLTRRGILSSVGCLYDPLGLIAPVVLFGKRILQQMCADKADWDDPLPEHLHVKWQQWRDSLNSLSSLKIVRCVKPENFGEISKVEMHHFSDASSVGYGQCSYIRFVSVENKVHCALLMGKSRVVPLKPITVPRLELVAATLSVKNAVLLQQELQFGNVEHVYWTDSKIVIGYVCNEARRFHVFVANRVQQIKDHSKLSQWHHVGTGQNPADIASRGIKANDLVENHMWFNGPSFLWELNLPLSENVVLSLDENDPEIKKTKSFLVDQSEEAMSFHSLLERLEYFSSWYRAKRAIALCLRFKRKLRQGSVTNFSSSNKKQLISSYLPVTVEEIHEAEYVICKIVQSESFKDEIEQLKQLHIVNSPASREEVFRRHRSLRSKSQLYRLDPFLDSNGVLRVGGRIQNTQADSSFNHPIVLPKKGHITELIVRSFHKGCFHQGRGITSNEIRQNGFWIIGLSGVVSTIISKCRECRKLRACPQSQKMSELPADRLEPSPPFTYCAVDLFGPFIIKEGRKELKRYGVLFTCMVCRAVHVETVNSLETDSFISSLRRFISLRGPIRQLRSDRGTNFVGANNELNQGIDCLDNEKIQQFLLERNCDYFPFKMNVPAASHMGGVWERQIRSVRSVLQYLLGNHGHQLDDESLRTFLHEAAAIVNCRPLTVENINDPLSAIPLTPNHLLTLKSKIILPPPGNFQREDLYSRKRWRRTQYLVEQFWSRWKLEFLQSLQVRNKWQSPSRNLCVGDVVILKEENMVRNLWKLARVVETIVDNDGLVRKVRIALADSSLDSKGKRINPVTYLERPIHKLVLLHETEEIPVGKPS